MFLGVLFALSLVSVALARGRITALAELELRRPSLVLAALGVQVAIISAFPEGDSSLYEALHLASYGLTGAFAWLNRRVPGLAFAAAGGALNFVAIAANGGVMPATASALRTAGLDDRENGFQNSAEIDGAHLQFLGDVFAVPASWPVSNVFSVGDVLLIAGVLYGLHVICGSWPARRLGRHPVTVQGVELVATGPRTGLVRVRTVPHRGMAPGDLVLRRPDGELRLEALPGSGATAGYAVDTVMLNGSATALELVLPNGSHLQMEIQTGAPG